MSNDKKVSEDIENDELDENIEDENESLQQNDETDCVEGGDDLEKLKEENQKLKDSFLRAYADAENTKKRCHQEMEKSIKFAIADFAKSLLPVADNLQRAIDASAKQEDEENTLALRKGIELTQSELVKVFDKFGVHKMDIMGTVFNPNFHQVVQEVVDADKPAGTVVAEVQTGYMIHDRILREAMVVVTKKD